MSQTNFFMTEADGQEFVEMLLKRSDTKFVLGRLHSASTPRFYDTLPSFGSEREAHLVNLSITPSPTCSRHTSDERWLFDSFRDVHIEFDRCYHHEGILVAGRIFAKIGWCADPTQNSDFQRWHSAIERWIKKRYRKLDSTFWIGPHAESWSISGGVLAFGSPHALQKSLKEA